MNAGKFIVFEGLDGCGKDTQMDYASKYLLEKDKYTHFFRMKEPSNKTPSGNEIKNRLKGEGFESGEQACRLYYQDRKELDEIRIHCMQNGAHILCARGDLTTYGYQSLMGMTFEEIDEVRKNLDVLIPDITFFFDVSLENIEKRIKNRGGKTEFFEKMDFLTKARQSYINCVERLSKVRNIYTIDANGTIEEVFEKVKTILDKELF